MWSWNPWFSFDVWANFLYLRKAVSCSDRKLKHSSRRHVLNRTKAILFFPKFGFFSTSIIRFTCCILNIKISPHCLYHFLGSDSLQGHKRLIHTLSSRSFADRALQSTIFAIFLLVALCIVILLWLLLLEIHTGNWTWFSGVVVVVVVEFILSRLLYLDFSANLGLLCMPHPGMGPLA